jgi:hypothetical protein
MPIRKEFAMVQVRIEIEYNVDLKTADMVAGVFEGKLVLNTANGERHQLYNFQGRGSIEKAQEMAADWVQGNLLEYQNPNCRKLRYLKVQEQ